jgi:hypothetical protein
MENITGNKNVLRKNKKNEMEKKRKKNKNVLKLQVVK